MHLFLLTSLTMCAFAANSLLTRVAVYGGHIDPVSFAILRVFFGALVLCVLVALRGGRLHWRKPVRWVGAASLAFYMGGFSLAYLTLDAGLGALILFGTVQIVVFGYGAASGKPATPRQLIGAGIAFAGLCIALWPGAGSIADPLGAGLMVCAGLGWAVYTISGLREPDPLAATACNFALCLPLVAAAFVFADVAITGAGVLLAAVAGAGTSGLGYALWFRVLSSLDPSRAAIVQLSVPVIAIAAGSILLSEPLSMMLLVSAGLVLGGIAFALRARSVPKGHS